MIKFKYVSQIEDPCVQPIRNINLVKYVQLKVCGIGRFVVVKKQRIEFMQFSDFQIKSKKLTFFLERKKDNL